MGNTPKGTTPPWQRGSRAVPGGEILEGETRDNRHIRTLKGATVKSIPSRVTNPPRGSIINHDEGANLGGGENINIQKDCLVPVFALQFNCVTSNGIFFLLCLANGTLKKLF